MLFDEPDSKSHEKINNSAFRAQGMGGGNTLVNEEKENIK